MVENTTQSYGKMMIKLTVVLAVIASALGFNLEMKAGKISEKNWQHGASQ